MLNIRLEGKLPIYEQLYNGISRLIFSGDLEPDERLPAVRELCFRRRGRSRGSQKRSRAEGRV